MTRMARPATSDRKPTAMERIIRPWEGALAPAAAEQFLRFGFDEADRRRSVELSEKFAAGTATEAERQELEDLVAANETLMLLQSKARLSLAGGRAGQGGNSDGDGGR